MTVTITDPRAIRALTNPVRFLAMEELYTTQRAHTASELARKADVLPGSMTYHLTILEKHGLVLRAEDEVDGDRRERPWLPAGTDFSIVASGVASDSDRGVLLEQRLQPMAQRMHALLRRNEGPRPAQLGYTIISTARMVLDAAERRAMHDEVEAVWLKYQALAAGRTEDDIRRSTRILWTVLPDDPAELGPDVE